MAYQSIPMTVDGGLNVDTPAVDLDNSSYSVVHNLRMEEGRLVPAQGYTNLFSPIPVAPEHVAGMVRQGTPEVYIAGEGAIYQNSNGIWTDVTRLTGGAYIGVAWNHTMLNQVMYFNNGADPLQILRPADVDFSDSATIPAGFRAKKFVGFKQYLFALNLTNGGTAYPHSLRWSDSADPGQEPPSWDITDPTTQAGELALAETDGEIVDAMPLKDNLIIYKTDSVYSVRAVGGIYVFSFTKLFDNDGLLTEGCVARYDEGHVFVGFEDIYVHDGIQMRSIAEGRVKKFFFADMNHEFYSNVFTVTHPEESEVWVCYPNDDSITGACNKALVWNWEFNTWATRDIPNLTSASSMIVDPNLADTWDLGVDTTWDLGDKHWDAGAYNPAEQTIVMASKDDDKLYELDKTALFDGAAFEWTLEKISAHLGDPMSIKYLNGIVPNISGQGSIDVRFGSQYNPGDGIAWGSVTQYQIGNFRHYGRDNGRYLSARLSGMSDVSNPLIKSYDIQVTQEGEK